MPAKRRLEIARALGTDDAAQGLFDLAARLGAPTNLAAIGMREDGLDKAAEIAVSAPYWNPRPFDRGQIRALLGDAYEGAGRYDDAYQAYSSAQRLFHDSSRARLGEGHQEALNTVGKMAAALAAVEPALWRRGTVPDGPRRSVVA